MELRKLSQALAYGAKVYTIEGTFDLALQHVIGLSTKDGRYLLNSINPWRIEGQKTIIFELLENLKWESPDWKTIIFELLENLKWESPDWIVTPAGNLGNTSAFGKALKEAQEW